MLRPLVSDERPAGRAGRRLRRRAGAARRAPRRRHLRVLRHRDRGAAARAGPGRRRPRRAAVAARPRRPSDVAEQLGPQPPAPASRVPARSVLPVVAGGARGRRDAAATTAARDRRLVDFHGAHQAGIATPVQGHLHFASFDVTTTDRAALVALLQDWTDGGPGDDRRPPGRRAHGSQSRLAPPSDTGEAVGLDAANLTLTVGFGPSPVRRPVRPGRQPAGSAGRPARLPRRHARPGSVRRRPRGAGLLRRPAGGRARGAQPDPDRRRPGRGPVGPARLRQGLVHRRAPARRRATCSASRTAPPTSSATTPTRSTEHVWAHRSDGTRLDGRRHATSSPAGSG